VDQKRSVGPLIKSGLLTAVFWVWAAKIITRPPATTWLASLLNTHQLNTTNVPSGIIWALIASLAGFVCFLVFANSLRVLLKEDRRARAAEQAAVRNAATLKELRATCSHSKTKQDSENQTYGSPGAVFEDNYSVVRCASCGKEISRKLSSKYENGKMTYNAFWYQ
jgi:hypothetical protein